MATVAELRESLGETAHDPMIALQLQELEAIEEIKDGHLPRLNEAAAGLDDKDAIKYQLEIVADFAKFNTCYNNTIKTLMAMLKTRSKSGAGADEDDPNALDSEQAYLTGGAHVKNKRKK